MIVFTGLMIGIVKGQEARQKWVCKKKSKYENQHLKISTGVEITPVVLDEFEMAAYHR